MGVPRNGAEDGVGAGLEHLPAADELVLAALVGVVLVELALEDVGVRERESTVVQGGEDAQRSVLRLCLNGQQDHVVDDARGHVDGVGGPFAHQLLDLFLEVGEVAGEGALPAGAHVALAQDLEELALVVVRGHLGVDLEALHVGLVELVRLPHTAGDGLAHLHRLLILHIGELVVEGTQQEHDGGEALLAVDDLQLTGGVLEGDDGTEEVLVVLAVESLKQSR